MWNLISNGRNILQKCPRYCIRKSVTIRGCSSKARDAARTLKPGEKVHGYTVQKVTEVPEFFITAVLLQHERTGTQHLHAAREDDNNTFSVQFRTTPMDSTGVPHILEHTVLCGSQKYPVRDPFFKMLSRSLATFMNALTAYDWTMYPFSTQNLQDYRNLMSVYLDAAFKPLLRELDFCQEGWRLEHEDPKNPSSPLVFKGVVYNEMKGVYSSSHNLFATAAVNKLLPSHTYGVNYGGDPRCIPDLTWQQLKDFHASHYHPSNARFFTYGNFPLAGQLEFIDAYLKDFSKISVNTSVPNEPRWTQPKQHSITCPPDPLAADQSKQTTVAVNFLLSNITDSYEKFVQQIMCQLLTEGEAAPFYSALLASNIGNDYAPITGYQGNTKEGTYSVGLQGILESDVERVIKIIDETLDKVIKEGFDPVRIKAILHTIELGQKHQTSNFGFNLSIGVSSHWNHDGDPVEMIQVNQLVDKFKKDLAKNPKMLQNKVKQYLKENPHRLTLTMSPDPEYMAKQEAEEKERLSKKITSLTEEDRKKIVARGEELLQKQMMKEDLTCLPSLKVTDIDRKIKPETTETNIVGDLIVQSSKQPTNGVTYVRLMTKLPEVDSELLPFVPLFCNVITGIGAAGHDYKWMSQQQELYTGGLNATTHISNHHTDPALLNQALVFSSYCLERNLKRMMDLWNMIFESPDFEDWERLTTLIRMSASDLATSIPQSGHMYALSHAAANLTPAASLLELFGGMTQVSLMKKVAEMQDLSEVVQKLQNIASLILSKNNMRIAVNATAEAMPEALKQIENWIRNVPGTPEYKPVYSEVKPPTETFVYTHFELPFSVNFVGQAFCAVPYAHPDRPVLTILGALMSRMYLHREIREKGGAYGSGAMAGDGVFTFFSYRDPHSTETLQTFEKSIEWAAKGSFTDQELELAKISVFQSIDKPLTPGNIGMRLFMDDLSDERRQKFRDRLFKATRDDIIRVTQMYLQPKDIVRGTCLLGPANPALREDMKWTVVKEDSAGQSQDPGQVQTQGATQ